MKENNNKCVYAKNFDGIFLNKWKHFIFFKK